MEKASGRHVYGENWTYATTSLCVACHERQAAQWKKTDHADAFASLEPSGKQRDPACIGCHTTGFLQAGGAQNMETVTAYFTEVGCESCHGPSQPHVARMDKHQGTSRKRRPRPLPRLPHARPEPGSVRRRRRHETDHRPGAWRACRPAVAPALRKPAPGRGVYTPCQRRYPMRTASPRLWYPQLAVGGLLACSASPGTGPQSGSGGNIGSGGAGVTVGSGGASPSGGNTGTAAGRHGRLGRRAGRHGRVRRRAARRRVRSRWERQRRGCRRVAPAAPQAAAA